MKRQEVVALLERFPELFDTDDELLEELTAEMHAEPHSDDELPNGKARVESEEWTRKLPR